MNTDSFFRKGYSHQICEDYALNENQNLFTFIVSDGCSNSEHTDIGSRLLSWSAKEVICSVGEDIINLSPSRIGKMIIDKAFISVKNLNIPTCSLDATLLLGFYNKNDNKIHVLVFGDGAIFFKNKNEDFDYKIFEYSKNYPFYLSYLLYIDGLDKFNEKKQKKTIKTKTYEEDCDSLYFSKYSFDVGHLEWLFVSTDGVESVFNTKCFEKIKEEKLHYELTSFKNYNGEFIKRRMKRTFRDLNKEDFDSEDDFSIAGINI